MKIDREVLYRELVIEDDDLCYTCFNLDDCPLLKSIRFGTVDIVDPDNFCVEDCASYVEIDGEDE